MFYLFINFISYLLELSRSIFNCVSAAVESRDASSPKQSRFELMYMEYKENKKYNVHVRSEQCQSHVADPNTQILANSRIYRETIIIGA